MTAVDLFPLVDRYGIPVVALFGCMYLLKIALQRLVTMHYERLAEAKQAQVLATDMSDAVGRVTEAVNRNTEAIDRLRERLS